MNYDKLDTVFLSFPYPISWLMLLSNSRIEFFTVLFYFYLSLSNYILNLLACTGYKRRYFASSKPFSYLTKEVSSPSGLRRGSAADRLLGLWVRIPPGAWMFLSCVLYSIKQKTKPGQSGQRSTENQIKSGRGV